MAKVRLTWSGNREAQRLADAAYRKLKKKNRKPKTQKKLRRKKKNRRVESNVNKPTRPDPLTEEFLERFSVR